MKTPMTDRWRYRRRVSDNYHHEDEVGYSALAAAIVKQAVEDYRYADACQKGEKLVKSASYNNRMAGSCERTKREIVRFFRSRWYGTLCDIDPNLILRKLGAIK